MDPGGKRLEIHWLMLWIRRVEPITTAVIPVQTVKVGERCHVRWLWLAEPGCSHWSGNGERTPTPPPVIL